MAVPTRRWLTVCGLHTLVAEALAVRAAGWTLFDTKPPTTCNDGAASMKSAWAVLRSVCAAHFGARLPCVLDHFRHTQVRPRAMTAWGDGIMERRLTKPRHEATVPLAFFHKPRETMLLDDMHTPVFIPLAVTMVWVQVKCHVHGWERRSPTQAEWEDRMLLGAPLQELHIIPSTPELESTSCASGSGSSGSDTDAEWSDDDSACSTEATLLTGTQRQTRKASTPSSPSLLRTALRVCSEVDPNVFGPVQDEAAAVVVEM